jgi:hypothetical protein
MSGFFCGFLSELKFMDSLNYWNLKFCPFLKFHKFEFRQLSNYHYFPHIRQIHVLLKILHIGVNHIFKHWI